MGYQLPAGNVPVSADWANHRNRTPPSSEPGTDYAAAYGQPVYAIDAGTVTYVKRDNSGGMGRTIQVMLDDGRENRPMHMSEVWPNVGDRVGRGQQLGLSGASGYGSDWYYGPHVHQTLWPGAAWQAETIDFENYVGGNDPVPPPDERDEVTEMLILIANADEPGQFAFWNERDGWKDLDYGNQGSAQMRGIGKMIAAASDDGQTQNTATLSGEEWIQTRGILGGK